MICYALVLVVAMGLRAYLMFENKRRDRVESAIRVPDDDPPVTAETDEEELTDWDTKGFRYRM
jgi:hypothetical protein